MDTHAAAVVSGAFLSGAMMSISLVAVPVIMDTTTETVQLLLQWARVYHYGHRIMPAMAICTSLLYGYSWTNTRGAERHRNLLALAGVATVSIIPFTLVIMVSTNNELFRLEAASKTEPFALDLSGAEGLVLKWTWLHVTRSLLPLAGAIIGTLAMV